MRHPELVPFGLVVGVRWLRGRDGRVLGQEFFEATPACQKSLLSLAKQVALKGRVGLRENGHQLQGEFDVLYELKPGNFRFIGFRHQRDFYITNGAMKRTKKGQIPDYRIALALRAEFFADQQESTRRFSR